MEIIQHPNTSKSISSKQVYESHRLCSKVKLFQVLSDEYSFSLSICHKVRSQSSSYQFFGDALFELKIHVIQNSPLEKGNEVFQYKIKECHFL